MVRKTYDDSFRETPLRALLTDAGVRSVAVCGLMSEMCVQATARTALALGYRVVLPYDGHATHDVPAEPGVSEVVPAAVVAGHATHDVPAEPGVSDVVPAAVVARVAAWPLSRDADVTARAADVTFTAPVPPVL
ncbi:Isochorismatase family protein [Streptomyces sp. BpilaLS-43]|nr:Isochorismatase family protein [Streptomyces sp. BpilaLS-43]